MKLSPSVALLSKFANLSHNRGMRIALRILKWFLIVLSSVVLLILLSIPIDHFLNRTKVDSLSNFVIPNSSNEVKVFLADSPDAELLPAVIMIHEFWGLKESILGKAQALADEGYVVVAPDTFRGKTASWVPTAIWQVISTKRSDINQDLDTVYAWLKEQPNVDSSRIMVMGFCYGGGASLAYSLENSELAATGIFYGSLITDEATLEKLPGPVLGIFGEKDQSIPVAEVNAFETALSAAGIDNQISIYEGQGHAFVQSIESINEGGVQAEAWQEFLDFTARTLKPAG